MHIILQSFNLSCGYVAAYPLTLFSIKKVNGRLLSRATFNSMVCFVFDIGPQGGLEFILDAQQYEYMYYPTQENMGAGI